MATVGHGVTFDFDGLAHLEKMWGNKTPQEPQKKWEPPTLTFEIPLAVMESGRHDHCRISAIFFIERLENQCRANGLVLKKRYIRHIIVYEVTNPV